MNDEYKDIGLITKNERVRAVVVAYFEVLSQNFYGEADENRENIQNKPSSGQDPNLRNKKHPLSEIK
jgi:hypothetical protein